MKKGSVLLRVIIGSLLGLFITWILLKQISLHAFLPVFKKISLFSLIIPFGFYVLSVFFRACRWRKMILSKTIPLSSIFCVTSIHNILNHLMPARTGELSYIVLLRKIHSIPSSQGVATLLLARIFDILSMAVFFLISIVIFWNQITVPRYRLFLTTFFSIPVILVVFVMFFSRRGTQTLQRFFEKTGLLKSKLALKVLEFMNRLAQDLYEIRKSRQLGTFISLTMLGWGTKFVAFYAIVRNIIFTHTITFWETVLGTTFSELASSLPIYGFAGFGTIEGGWTLGFLLIGFKKEEVIAGAFCFHVLLLSFALILGLLGFLFLKWKPQNKSSLHVSPPLV